MTDSIRISPDVLVARLEGEAVLLHLDTKQYYRLNETAAAIWKCLEDELDADAIVSSLVRDFDVQPDTARTELDRVLADLRDRRLVEDG